MVDIQDEHAEGLQNLSLKVADLEDCTRCNIITFRGVPETVNTSEIVPYLQQLICKLLSLRKYQDMLLDRAHRIQKLKHLPASIPKDTLACVHFFFTSNSK